MKRFLGVIAGFVLSANVFAEGDVVYWSQSQNIASFEADENIVQENVVLGSLTGSGISIVNPMLIRNYGTIDADLIATDDFSVHIYNGGAVTGTVQANHLIQFVTSNDNLHLLTVNSPDFTVVVDNFNAPVNLTDLQGLNAGRYQFKNSSVVIDNFLDWQNWNVAIEWLSGTNTLYINDYSAINSGTTINNINPDVQILILTQDNLYQSYLEYINQTTTVLNVVQQNNYQQIFGDDINNALLDIQSVNPNDDLLVTMNSVNDVNVLHSIINSSYRFNPSVLMRPIMAIDNFSIIDNLGDVRDNGVVPWYIGSRYMRDVGGRAYIGAIGNDSFSLSVGLNFNKFDYNDNINDFSGIAYGADIRANKKIDNFVIKGLVGFNLIDFQTDTIYVNNNIENNPFGYSLYGGIDGLYDFDLGEGWNVAPFFGVMFHRYNLLDNSDFNIDLRSGCAAKYNFTIDSIKYEYGLYGGVVSNGDVFAIARIGFESLVDRVGVFLDIGGAKDEYAWNYRASANVKIAF